MMSGYTGGGAMVPAATRRLHLRCVLTKKSGSSRSIRTSRNRRGSKQLSDTTSI